MAELAGRGRQLLALELGELVDFLPAQSPDISLTGFEIGEVDLLFEDMAERESSASERTPDPPDRPFIGRQVRIETQASIRPPHCNAGGRLGLPSVLPQRRSLMRPQSNGMAS